MRKTLLFILMIFSLFCLASCNKECTIKYDDKVVSIEVNTTFTLPELEKDGYIFLGWYKDQNYTDGPYTEYIPVNSGEVNFYSKWIDIETHEINIVVELINGLKDISLDDENKVNETKNKYDELSLEQKTKVTNYNLLEEALEKIIELKANQALINEVIAAINTIPQEVTLATEDLVLTVLDKYNNLNKDLQSKVTNYNVLQNAINTIQSIKDNIQAVIDNLIESINSLPEEITLNEETKVNQLIEIFASLTEEQKLEITNYTVLLSAKTKIAALKQQEMDKEAASQMDEIINTLPDVITLEDEEEVLRIKELYDALTTSQKIKVTTYSKLKKALEKINHIKEQNETLEKTIKAIDNLPDEITVDVESKIHHANALYILLDDDYKKKVTNYEKLEAALEIIRNFDETVKTVIVAINKIPSNLKLEDKELVVGILADYNSLDDNQKNLVTNYNKLEAALDILVILQEEYDKTVKVAKQFDTKIASLPINIKYNDKKDIVNLINEYNSLPEEVKMHVSLLDKLNGAKKVIDDIESDVDNITYVLGENVYTSKSELYESFFGDYYWFIYGYYGEEALTSKGVYDVDDFLTLGRTPGNQSTKYRVLADTFSYFLTKDVNGLKENQPESTFIGHCMKNGKYEEIIDFFIMFFAYWRIDEGYANTNNYGADFFAEGWAPQVDICKFFNYTETTKEVPKTSRVLDCFKNIEGVVSGTLTTRITDGMTLTTNLTRRGYKFAGWYDNPNCTGSPVTTVSKTGEKVILYAKWEENKNIQDSDAASLVDIYIYNLTTSKANVSKQTVGYTRNLYNALSDNAKKLVTKYDTFTKIENKYN